MTESFEFVDETGRKFTCNVEHRTKPASENWWWFRVSTDANNRYALFRTEQGDTQASVQAHIASAYDEMLARRAAPTVNRWQRRGGAGPQLPNSQATADSALPPGTPAAT